MPPEDERKAYEDFYNSARHNKILASKTTLMIHLVTAVAVSCYPGVESYLGVARAEGITESPPNPGGSEESAGRAKKAERDGAGQVEELYAPCLINEEVQYVA